MRTTRKHIEANLKWLAEAIKRAGGNPTGLTLDHYSPGGNPYTWKLAQSVHRCPDTDRYSNCGPYTGGEHDILTDRAKPGEIAYAIRLATRILEDYIGPDRASTCLHGIERPGEQEEGK